MWYCSTILPRSLYSLLSLANRFMSLMVSGLLSSRSTSSQRSLMAFSFSSIYDVFLRRCVCPKRKPHSRHQRVRRKITQFYGFHRELMGADQWAETAFRPTMDPMRVVIKTNRHNVAGSLKKIMPTSTVPTAPMPVHTAYAVPSGSVCVALTSKAMLAVRHTRKLPYHQ